MKHSKALSRTLPITSYPDRHFKFNVNEIYNAFTMNSLYFR
jgi:hypothetical protein